MKIYKRQHNNGSKGLQINTAASTKLIIRRPRIYTVLHKYISSGRSKMKIQFTRWSAGYCTS